MNIQDKCKNLQDTIHSLLEQKRSEAEEKAALRTQLMETQNRMQQQSARLLDLENARELLKVRSASLQFTVSLCSAHQA